MGDRSAAALYARYGGLIFSRCRRLLKNPADAQDAVQEVFVRALAHLHELEDERAIVRWLLRVSTNHCLNVLRNTRRRAEKLEALGPGELDSPERLYADHEMVTRLLAGLPAKVAAPAMLCYIDGMSHDEIAATLGVSRGTVINRLNEFKRRAQRLLGKPVLA